MCPPPKVTAGAVLMSALSTKTGAVAVAVAGSGVALYAVAGTALNAWVIMGLVGTNAITGIVLLVKRANRPEPIAGVVPPRDWRQARVTHRLVTGPACSLTQAAPIVHELTIAKPTSAPYLSA